MEKCGWRDTRYDIELYISKHRYISENWLQKSPYLSQYTNKLTGKFGTKLRLLEKVRMLKALVITPNEKTTEFGSILAVARAEARKREQSKDNPPIRALRFFPELNLYVAVYEAIENQNPNSKQTR